MTPTSDYLEKCRELLVGVAAQEETIQRAAEWFAKAIASGRVVHLFGSGHSRIAVEEMWPRYGSFPGFHPIVELSLTYHNQVVGLRWVQSRRRMPTTGESRSLNRARSLIREASLQRHRLVPRSPSVSLSQKACFARLFDGA